MRFDELSCLFCRGAPLNANRVGWIAPRSNAHPIAKFRGRMQRCFMSRGLVWRTQKPWRQRALSCPLCLSCFSANGPPDETWGKLHLAHAHATAQIVGTASRDGEHSVMKTSFGMAGGDHFTSMPNCWLLDYSHTRTGDIVYGQRCF